MKYIILLTLLLSTSVCLADKIIYNKLNGDIIVAETDDAKFEDGFVNGHFNVYKLDYSNNQVFASVSNLFLYDENNSIIGNKTNISEVSDLSNIYPISNEEMQMRKPFPLKVMENQFFGMCMSLGFTNKPGFEEIAYKVMSMATNVETTLQSHQLGLMFLQIDAGCKRYDMKWWDSAEIHPEVDF